ncbi:MAG: fumarate hydratase [Proteobacteria bacterium]|nr:MAG: fumarate hydratase [Pseudomonadota bacterium]
MSHLKEIRLKLPVGPEDIARLEPGNIVYFDGVVYTAREGVYQKVIGEGQPLPVKLADVSNVNFHCSPAASRSDDGTFKVGGVTATASFRFSKWMRQWLELTGTRIIIGKGGMPLKDYKDILAPMGAVYMTTVGYGTGALLGRGITGVRDVFWLDELGLAQAMWLFEVSGFGPFIVDSDLDGNSLFAAQGEEINRGIGRLYDDLRPPALHRYGETDNREDELL